MENLFWNSALLRKDKESNTWCAHVIILYIIATFEVGLIFWRYSPDWSFWGFVVAQVLVIVLYYFQGRQYFRDDNVYGFRTRDASGERFTTLSKGMLVAAIVSIGMPLLGALAAGLPWSSSTPHISADMSRLRGQLDAIRSELDTIEGSEVKRLKDVEAGMVDVRRKLDILEETSKERLDLQRSDVVAIRRAITELRDRLDDLNARWEGIGAAIKSKK